MSNFDDKNFIPKLMCEMYCQNLTDKMFIIFGIEFTEVHRSFRIFRTFVVKGKEPTVTILLVLV